MWDSPARPWAVRPPQRPLLHPQPHLPPPRQPLPLPHLWLPLPAAHACAFPRWRVRPLPSWAWT